jgi:hypothetical protein
MLAVLMSVWIPESLRAYNFIIGSKKVKGYKSYDINNIYKMTNTGLGGFIKMLLG